MAGARIGLAERRREATLLKQMASRLAAPGGMGTAWYALEDPSEIASPALLVYPDRIRENIRRMLAVVGRPERLRPHVKTHKMPEVVRLQVEAGIHKFKCATIAEAEMLGACGAADVLIAHQPVGPNVRRIFRLIEAFPKTRYSAIVDDESVIRALSRGAVDERMRVELLLDLNSGMNRCGTTPGADAFRLYRLIESLPGVIPGGLHTYDGHIRMDDPGARRALFDSAMAPVYAFRDELEESGLSVPRLVGGGSPTFSLHAQHPDTECSPGTPVLWDAGYGSRFLDMDYLPAAVMLTRVISRPAPRLLCLDLGHKAVAAENPAPRVFFPQLPDAAALAHSEEHLVLESAEARSWKLGDVLYGIPYHICPTCALYGEALAVENGKVTSRWLIQARERRLSI